MTDLNLAELYARREKQACTLASQANDPDIAAMYRILAVRYAELVDETASAHGPASATSLRAQR